MVAVENSFLIMGTAAIKELYSISTTLLHPTILKHWITAAMVSFFVKATPLCGPRGKVTYYLEIID